MLLTTGGLLIAMGAAMTTRQVLTIFMLALALAVAGCQPRQKIATERERKEAAQLGSEAQFAMTMRQWARAEGLYAQATKLHPDGSYYTNLGAARIKLGNRAGAKDAYQEAIKSCELDAQLNPADPEPWLRQAYLLALLGRVDDGRAQLKKTEKKFPNHRRVRAFIDGKQFDAMIASPGFKENAL